VFQGSGGRPWIKNEKGELGTLRLKIGKMQYTGRELGHGSTLWADERSVKRRKGGDLQEGNGS